MYHNSWKSILLGGSLALMSTAGTIQAEPQEHFPVPMDQETWTLTPEDAGLTGRWLGSVKMTTLHGGRQEGVKLITVENGALSFTVIPTRGMSLYRVQSGDVTLGWDSPVKEIVHPAYVNLESRGGLGWLDAFNEYLVRCGIEWAGHPGDDNGRLMTLHGKAGNIPASRVGIKVDAAPPHRIHVLGMVEEKTFKFVNYELQTDVSTVPGTKSFRFNDQLRNRSAYATEYQMIYHANYGASLLGEGATFVAPVKKVTPFDAYAAKDLDSWTTYLGPTPNYGEQVYCVEMSADAEGMTSVMLRNPKADRGVAMSYDTRTLPYFSLWKNTDTLEDGYVTGLEPSTSYPTTRSFEREGGRIPKIGPGETVNFKVEVSILGSADAVSAQEKVIATLQGGVKPELVEAPVKPPEK